VRWRQRGGHDKLHWRYILTKRGGLGLDVEIAKGKPGETADVTLVHPELSEKRWADFQDDASNGNAQPTAFEKVDDLRIRGTRR
jgi:hypothetical protein